MEDVKWIKIITDIFDDEKIQLIDSLPEHDSIIVIWFKLLCLAGKQNNGGVFLLNNKIPYTDEMLAAIFRRPINTVRLAINTFTKFGMVEVVNNVYTLPNWEKHQSVDKLEKIKEQTRNRVAAHRQKQKELAECNATVALPVTQGNATELDIDKDIDIDIKKEYKKETPKEKAKRFSPPSIEEVKAYCSERKNSVDPQKFIDYYTANGWVQGKGKPIKDWQATVRTWERSTFNGNTGTAKKTRYEPKSRTDTQKAIQASAAIMDEELISYGKTDE